MNFRLFVAGAIFFMLFGGSAMASATLSCSIEDKTVELTLMGTVGAFDGSGTSVSVANLKVAARGGWPEQTFEFAPESEHSLNLGQEWRREPELRLWLSSLDEVDLIMLMKRKEPDETSDYRGTYQLAVKANGKERKHSGPVTCSIGH